MHKILLVLNVRYEVDPFIREAITGTVVIGRVVDPSDLLMHGKLESLNINSFLACIPAYSTSQVANEFVESDKLIVLFLVNKWTLKVIERETYSPHHFPIRSLELYLHPLL